MTCDWHETEKRSPGRRWHGVFSSDDVVEDFDLTKLVRKHACIDGHIIDWDKFLPRFDLFKRRNRRVRRDAGWRDGVLGNFKRGG
jgi:hypothetical protein